MLPPFQNKYFLPLGPYNCIQGQTLAAPALKSNQNLNGKIEAKFEEYRKRLLEFLGTHTTNEPKVNLPLIKKYYKIPFDIIPTREEVLPIFDNIVERITLNKSQLKNWYQEDLKLLVWVVIKHSFSKLTDIKLFKESDWKLIGEIIPFKSAEQCKFKWLSMERINLQEKPWTVEEDEILQNLVINNPNKKWTDIAKLLFIKSGEIVYRAGKFCRERWNNYLSPDLKKGLWFVQEDIDLFERILKIGKKWSEISKSLIGRTENSVKNRFNSLVRKWMRTHSYAEDTEETAIIKDLYQSLLERKNAGEGADAEKSVETTELFRKYSRHNPQKSNKKISHLEEIKKKPSFNLLYELLKNDISKIEVKKEPNFVKIEKIEDNSARLHEEKNKCFEVQYPAFNLNNQFIPMNFGIQPLKNYNRFNNQQAFYDPFSNLMLQRASVNFMNAFFGNNGFLC